MAKVPATIPFPDVTSATPRSVVLTGSCLTQGTIGSLPQSTTVQVSRTNEDTQETAQLP